MSTIASLRRGSLATLVLLALGGGPAHAVTDHLKCFRMQDLEVPNSILTAEVLPTDDPPFAAQTCRIKQRAGELCVAVEKSNVRDRNGEPFPVLPVGGGPAGDYLCYRLRCPRIHPRPGIPLEVRDQLGTRTVFVKKPDFFCAPAETLVEE